MQKLCLSLTSVAVAIYAIFIAIIIGIEGTDSVDLWIVCGFGLGVAAGTYTLSLMGYLAILGNKGALRLIILICVAWIYGSLVELSPYQRYGSTWETFIGVAILPTLSYLGLLWVISGFRSRKRSIPEK